MLLFSCAPGIKEKPADKTEQEQGATSAAFCSSLARSIEELESEPVNVKKLSIQTGGDEDGITAFGKLIFHQNGKRSWIISSGSHIQDGAATFFSGYSIAGGNTFLFVSGKTKPDKSLEDMIKAEIINYVDSQNDSSSTKGYLFTDNGTKDYFGAAALSLEDYSYANLSYTFFQKDKDLICALNASEEYSWMGDKNYFYSFYANSEDGILKKFEKASGNGYDEVGKKMISRTEFINHQEEGKRILQSIFTSNFGSFPDLRKTTLTHYHRELARNELDTFVSLDDADLYDAVFDIYALSDGGCFYMLNIIKKDSGFACYGAVGYEKDGKSYMAAYNDNGGSIFKKDALNLESFKKHNLLEKGKLHNASCKADENSFLASWDGNLCLLAHSSNHSREFLYLDGFAYSYAKDESKSMKTIPEKAKTVLFDLISN